MKNCLFRDGKTKKIFQYGQSARGSVNQQTALMSYPLCLPWHGLKFEITINPCIFDHRSGQIRTHLAICFYAHRSATEKVHLCGGGGCIKYYCKTAVM